MPSRLEIRHFTDSGFLDAFRRDLAGAAEHALILSPFLSRNRAMHYYPVLHALTTRGVSVDVYARPKHEQPDTLRDHFDLVKARLESIGARVHLRPGMHEKIGVVDGVVLWHGSLNPLSHNDTRESMLRIESKELTKEILTTLALERRDADHGDGREGPSDRGPEVGEVTPNCPACGRVMRFYEDAGMWICVDSPVCPGAFPAVTGLLVGSPEVREAAAPAVLDVACPVCGTPLEVRRGIRTRIMCGSASCGFALDPRLSAGILRVLSRSN
jgi:hypothetical protein